MPVYKTAVLFGGRSAEHEVSIRSAVNIIKNLLPARHEVVLIGVDRKGGFRFHETLSQNPGRDQVNESLLQTIIQEGEPLLVGTGQELPPLSTRSGKEIQVDVVFPILHGSYGEDGRLQGLLEMANLPYVGPDLYGSSIGMDKALMKRLLKEAGIPSAAYMELKSQGEQPEYGEVARLLGEVLFVKPAKQGSSVGVHRVTDPESWKRALEDAFLYDHTLLVEEEIKGQEIECAVLGNENPRASIVGEIVPATAFYSYESKYLDDKGASLEMPARIPESVAEEYRNMAIATYRTLLCEGMARVDGFLKPDGQLYINEINTLPGFTSVSMYPVLWEKTGKPFPELMDELVQLGIDRQKRDSRLKTTWRND